MKPEGAYGGWRIAKANTLTNSTASAFVDRRIAVAFEKAFAIRHEL